MHTIIPKEQIQMKQSFLASMKNALQMQQSEGATRKETCEEFMFTVVARPLVSFYM